MILGIDVGSFSTKSSNLHLFESKVSKSGNFTDKFFYVNNQKWFLAGEQDTTYRKINRENYIALLTHSIAESTTSKIVKCSICVGLPIGQYKEDKNYLIQLINNNKVINYRNEEKEVTIYIDQVNVCVEGIAAIPIAYEGIVIDIGGKTTDIFATYIENKRRKIENPYSMPTGTLNLYSDFINYLNNMYCLDLKVKDARRILEKGLIIKGVKVDTSNAMQVFKLFLQEIINKLQNDYSVDTNNVLFVGGGSKLLFNNIKKQIQHAELIENSIFANALGYFKEGKKLWQIEN